MNKITPVILSGDSGTRRGPLSHAGFPKQFLVLSGFTSLFQKVVAAFITKPVQYKFKELLGWSSVIPMYFSFVANKCCM